MGMIDADTLDMLRRKAHAAETVDTEDLPLLPGESPPPEPIDPAQEWAGLLGMAVAVATPIWPYLSNLYTPEVIEQVGRDVAPVAQKYGVSMGGVAGPELKLAMTVIPLAIAHVMVHRAWKAEQDAARTVENGGQPAPEARTAPSHLGGNFEDNGGRLMPQGA